MRNPFFEPPTETGIPAFDKIEFKHYREAMDRGFAEHDKEIAAIISDPDAPNFANTVEALERSGGLLREVFHVFRNMASSDTSDELQALEREVEPEYAAHQGRITSNPDLFKRIKTVMDGGERLHAERQQLLKKTYTEFVRSGAELPDADRARVSAINERLALKTTEFGQNVLRDTNDFALVLEEGGDLAGLPAFVLAMAAEEALARDLPGKFVFTISRSSITPFLQYANRRDLREKIYRAYTGCGVSGADNRAIIKDIVSLRSERARLLGFASHAAYMLDDRMAKTPEAVRFLLDRVWEPCQTRVAEEAADLQARIEADGGTFSLEPWDWWYYTEKVRQQRFDLAEEEVKPYFRLENVRDGVFDVAQKLYGITFKRRTDIRVYHPEVEAYEVNEADGALIGYFLFDFFMRPSKRGGAWMSVFRPQSDLDGRVYPVIVNCCNFPRSEPCFLGMDEVRTLFHEFGHGLHGLLSNVRYESLGGTNVKQDFVELPSQIMEHWAREAEVLKSYALHFQTGEPIPDTLIAKLRASECFNQGFATTEYLAACYLDLAWHETADAVDVDVDAFEQQAMAKIGNIRVVDPRYKSPYFQHIFAGEHYSAGYYVYLWAEVLDADGFEAFKENGLFDQATARSFRNCILEKGGSVDPMDLYKAFRGREPDVQPLLRNRGFAVD